MNTIANVIMNFRWMSEEDVEFENIKEIRRSKSCKGIDLLLELLK